MTRISFIIPAMDTAETLARTIASAQAIADEVIVAVPIDADDEMAAVARSCGVRIVDAAADRGPLLHAGAKVATGDVLVFLFPGTHLPFAARSALLEALRSPRIVGGNFRLHVEGDRLVAWLFARAYDWRRRMLGVYSGDSAIFVRRHVYRRMGGFKPWVILEDQEFTRRLGREGETVQIRQVSAVDDGARFENLSLPMLAVYGVVRCLSSIGTQAAPSPRLARESG